MLEEIPFKALPEALVEKIEIDVAQMHIGDTIKVKDLEIASDKDVTLQIDPEEVIVTLMESHNVPEVDDAETSEA